eukprot:CAMPEP_0205905004 /NCGR_PEP_ID=MMETSP1325-20131115/1090_1 /ASSEMBLY_ACC=CAM_ASM_000708 /TAXON_ID=236786 /ORGANISM="Florenciella sp., Strain RCC1007" /LENGTH=62 /DNA_ID=CAMNT_0053270871 /DNA_START=24 /DNA_END=208 /DNA_ORIENTATION=+
MTWKLKFNTLAIMGLQEAHKNELARFLDDCVALVRDEQSNQENREEYGHESVRAVELALSFA